MHWDDPEGWYGEGGERGFRMGNTCTPVVDSSQCMAKAIQYCNWPPIKINKFILKLKNKLQKEKIHEERVAP